LSQPLTKTGAKRARRDLTSGHIPSQIVQLSLPSALNMALSSSAMLLHAFWMSKVSELALGAVAMGTTLRIVLISPMMGLSAGGMAMVARFVGAQEDRRADHVVMQCVALIVLFVTPLAVIGQLLGPTFLGWMGAEGELRQEAMAYLRIIFGGLFFIECLPSMNGIIQGAGHPEYVLRISIVNVVVLSLLEPVLALGWGPIPALGVRGAAWATVLGSASGVAAQAITLLTGKAGVRLHIADIRPDLAIMRRILRIAIPSSAQRFSPNLANALLMRLVTAQGVIVLTAYSVVNQISSFLQTPSMGLANAAATLMGQNLGAHKPERAARATRLTTVMAVGLATVLFGCLAIWPRTLLSLFSASPAVLSVAIAATPYYVVSGAGVAWYNVMSRALGGAGDTVSPLLVNVVALWLVQLPMGWLLSQPVGLGAQGVWLGLAIGNLTAGAATGWLFRRGRWRTMEI
jgi:putative MATE family efflux protein